MRPGLPITARVINVGRGDVTIQVSRGARQHESVIISPDLLLSFGIDTADAADFIRAIVSEINTAMVALQSGPVKVPF